MSVDFDKPYPGWKERMAKAKLSRMQARKQAESSMTKIAEIQKRIEKLQLAQGVMPRPPVPPTLGKYATHNGAHANAGVHVSTDGMTINGKRIADETDVESLTDRVTALEEVRDLRDEQISDLSARLEEVIELFKFHVKRHPLSEETGPPDDQKFMKGVRNL